MRETFTHTVFHPWDLKALENYLKTLPQGKFTGKIVLHIGQGGLRGVELEQRVTKKSLDNSLK